MNEAYFSNIRGQIIPLLKRARKEIKIAMAWFTSSELFDILLTRLRNGVKVHLVLLDNPINFMEYAPDFNKFIATGGVLKIADPKNGFMHHKFCVIDDDYVITGSYNWTYYAETRNIENIIVSDHSSIIAQYTEAFLSLYNRIPAASSSPRYQWSDIEDMNMVDFTELNYEVNQIAKSKHLPQRQVVQTISSISITERPLHAVSKYNIGLLGDDGSKILIPVNQTLPFISSPLIVYNSNKHMVCAIFKMDENNKVPIVKEDVNDITLGKIDQTIQIQFTLHESGELIGTIRCLETGKVFDIKKRNLDLIDYVD